MGLRDDLVLRAVGSLMGPQGGFLDSLPPDRDPRDEYITGVLEPRPLVPGGPVALADPDAEAELVDGDVADEEDADDPGTTVPPPVFSPALDPRRRPCSIGLNFVVEAEAEPSLSACFTCARYFQDDDDRWVRQPLAGTTTFETIRDGDRRLYAGDIELRYRVTTLPGNPFARRVSVFLINVAAAPPPDEPVPTRDLVFQPQIRIRLDEGTRLAALRRAASTLEPSEDDALLEEASLELLYRGRPVLARGHMCGAVWKEIDPERPLPDGGDNPFVWLDEEAVSREDRARFRLPDVRTEIVPLYPVCSPEMGWRAKYGPEPELNPSDLAATWEGAALSVALQPLAGGYSRWIGEMEDQLSHLGQFRPVAERHLEACRSVRDRIRDGIDLLEEDPEVRLAFCFANRAIALQADWKKSPTRWRPFQLAFLLLCLRGVADRDHPDRETCDLLWFATGGGKTEAYLGLTAFALGLRRLRTTRNPEDHALDTGTGVISRYTLRLLTIQQFRRALGLITACEMLRIMPFGEGLTGWRPSSCPLMDDHLWGTARFSAGLWVGGGVTPNSLYPSGFPQIPGALKLLREHIPGHGEPAQVLRCPCCGSHLAVAHSRHERQERAAFSPGSSERLHLVFYCEQPVPVPNPGSLSDPRIEVTGAEVRSLPAGGFHTLSISFSAKGEGVSAADLDRWWESTVRPRLPRWSALECARASRPGYFIRRIPTGKDHERDHDFEIFCPDPDCSLASYPWREKAPTAGVGGAGAGEWREVAAPFQSAADPRIGTRVPIPALTVDDQVYSYPPSLIVATVDKFARLAFEPRAASLFGFVTHYHARDGYYRQGCPRKAGADSDHPPQPALKAQVARFAPPDLILQDELHLIDGPLGSMVGIYETAMDALAEQGTASGASRPKYVASTATVRQASEQVQSLFCRNLVQFPPPGLSADDSFFALTRETHPVEDARAGRLYVGVCAPGKGAQTPIVRVWSVLLQAVFDARFRGVPPDQVDSFWTLVGYFNAIRELAGATGLYRQDIPQRINHIAGGASTRELPEDLVELSSRADALLLPALLSRLETPLPGEAESAALATSMFGTGVDVTRLGLMVVHGQPKTSSAYIQATGRVGRAQGGLVVTFLRASRPRDLDHYEFFTGYHRQLYRAVEPITVAPFSPRARERSLGPLCVTLLRQAERIGGQPVHDSWRNESPVVGAQRMAIGRSGGEVVALRNLLEARAAGQPDGRRPEVGVTGAEVASELDRWRALAQKHPGGQGLVYQEYALAADPKHPVVLGDAQHQRRQLEVAYPDAPQSLRDVEPTTGFKI